MSPPRVLHDFGELPRYRAVLTAAEGPLDVRSDTKRAQLAVLLLEPAEQGKAWLLASADAQAHDRASLATTTAQHGYEIVEKHAATPELLRDIHAARVQSRDDENGSLLDGEEPVRWLDGVLAQAVEFRATDIHLEQRETQGHSAVRMRIHGRLDLVARPEPRKMAVAIGAAFTLMADPSTRNMPTFSADAERNCIIERQVAGEPRRFRFESFPVLDGLDCVLRVLQGAMTPRTLADLGYAPYHVHLLKLAILASKGLIVIAGTTGSGKSTAALSLLAMHPDYDSIKTYSLEDPSEYRIQGVSQYSIKRSTDDLTQGATAYVEGAKTFLRADPDQVLIGEVRGRDVGSVLASLVQTGHRAITTLHTGSALEAIPRMAHDAIGIDRQTLCARGFLSAVAYQVLLPRLCERCSTPAVNVLDGRYLQLIREVFYLEDLSGLRVRGMGCDHPKCRKGVADQTLAAEVIMPDSTLLQMLREGRDADAENYWRLTRRSGFSEPDMEGKTAFEHGFWKALQGMVDPRDLEHAFEPFERYRYTRPVGLTQEERGMR